MPLKNPKHQQFVNNLLKGMGEQQAYEAVRGYKARGPSAAAAATRLLKNGKIRTEFNNLKQKAANQAEATQERILREECRIAYSDLADLFDGFTTIAPHELPEDVRRAVSAIKIKTRYYGIGDERETETTYEYKFWDKGRALERISKHLGMYEKDNRQKYDPAFLAALLSVFPPDYAEKVKQHLSEGAA